jgi:hypothetical protein
MLKNVKYFPPQAKKVRIQMEGVIADSNCPRFKNNQVRYEEYTTEALSSPANQDVIII